MGIYATHTIEELKQVMALKAEGLGARTIHHRTGIPFGTVQGWLRKYTPETMPAPPGVIRANMLPLTLEAGAMLLGLYLGHGHLTQIRDTTRLRLMVPKGLDPWTVDAWTGFLDLVRGERGRTKLLTRGHWAAVLSCYWTRWPSLLPFPAGPEQWTEQHEIALAAEPSVFLQAMITGRIKRTVKRMAGRYLPYYEMRHRSPFAMDRLMQACDYLGLRYGVQPGEPSSVLRIANKSSVERVQLLLTRPFTIDVGRVAQLDQSI